MKSIWKIFGTYLLILFFILVCSNVSGQTKFCSEQDSVCVVEFNAYWNKENNIVWLDSLVDCGVTRILITDKQELAKAQKKYSIQNVPTIIIFKRGKEVERFQACLRFKIGTTRKEVQEKINKLFN